MRNNPFMIKNWIVILAIFFTGSIIFADEIIVDFEKESVPIVNEELRKIREDVGDTEDDIATNVTDIATNVTNIATNITNIAAIDDLWETDGGDAELKTADDIDAQNMQIKGMCIENRTDDTGCTQTGRIWFRTDI